MQPPLRSIRIIECSMLGPAGITTALADLGADVIKVEPPSGDYVRQMTWPIIEGTSLMHLHLNRGKRGVVIDLRTDAGKGVFLDLVRESDGVIEAMRPGGLERRGLGFEQLRHVNPRIVFMTISGYGMTGPYRDMPSHGIAYDTWAGIVTPAHEEDGRCYIPEHVSIGINAGPLYGAIGVLAGVVHARATGEGMQLEIAQSDAAAAFDWYRSETWKAYERPESEVTGNAADGGERRAPGIAGMRGGVRYQMYETLDDRHILFMASEQALWHNFCEGVDRIDLYERWPGSKYGDHAKDNLELQAELRSIFATRTAVDWIKFGIDANTPIAPVNTPANLGDDSQFIARLGWVPASRLGADELPSPVKIVGDEIPLPTMAPTLGQHTDDVLRDVLGYDDATLESKREAGAFGG